MQIHDLFPDKNFIGEKSKISFGSPNGPMVFSSPRKISLMNAVKNHFASQGQTLTETGLANASMWMNEIYQNNNAVSDQEVLTLVVYWLANGR